MNMASTPSEKQKTGLGPGWTALLLFGAALLPRLPGLGRFLTSDENTNIFFAGSDVISAFLSGNLRDTYWHFYPGVTMSWLDGLGLAGQYLLDVVTGQSPPAFGRYIYSDILSLLVAVRLPYVVLSAAAVAGLYLLARQLLTDRVALLGAIFMAFDPFYLAHSRVAHGDAPVAVFMSISALAFFIFLEQPPLPRTRAFGTTLRHVMSRPYLLLSAVFGGLAALTKAPGQFMALFVLVVTLLLAAQELHRPVLVKAPRPRPGAVIGHWLAVILVWGVVSLAVFILLWPAMWVDPLGTTGRMLQETFSKVNEGHLVFFWGQPTLDPGFWFYFYVVPFRLTPIILLGTILSLLVYTPRQKTVVKGYQVQRRGLFYLWLFAISLLLFGNLSPKKQDRYLLPLFPILSFVAAVGWVCAIDLAYASLSISLRNRLRPKKTRLLLIPMLVLVLLHIIPVFIYYPYYLAYFNPLMGGPQRARQTTLIGWGEGMEQAAAYLNRKPEAHSLYVASTPSQALLPYFAGRGENFYTNDIAFRADYVVLYLAQMQRLAPSPEIVRYFQAQEPEETITIAGLPYANIYPGPGLILSDIPPEATPVNIGLDDTIRLAGYKLDREPPAITLYWHALTVPPEDYTISVRAHAADGTLLAQQDQWPVDGLLPTSQWRQGDYVADTHTIETDMNQVNTIEVVVYNAASGQALGEVITMKNE